MGAIQPHRATRTVDLAARRRLLRHRPRIAPARRPDIDSRRSQLPPAEASGGAGSGGAGLGDRLVGALATFVFALRFRTLFFIDWPDAAANFVPETGWRAS
jgi:hypothetical protein